MKPKDIEKKLKELDELTLKLATENFEISQKINDLDEKMEEIWKVLPKPPQ